MMLQSLYEAEIAEPDACFPLSSRGRVKRNVALYAEMLGFSSPATCPPERYIKPRADLRAFVATHAPKALAGNTVKNCYNDNAKLIESGIARGWLAAPTSPLYPWPHPDRHIRPKEVNANDSIGAPSMIDPQNTGRIIA